MRIPLRLPPLAIACSGLALSPVALAQDVRGTADLPPRFRRDDATTEAPVKDAFLPDPPSPAFGEPGELVLSGTAVGSFSVFTYDETQAAQTDVSFGPGLDVFVVRRLSLGLALSVRYTHVTSDTGSETTRASFSVGPRVGYVIPLTEKLSFWPTLSVGFSNTREQRPGRVDPQAADASWSGLWLGAYAPILVHLRPRVFVGFGPTIFRDFAGATQPDGPISTGTKSTAIGAALVVGGFWGGQAEDAPPGATDFVGDATRRRRFGDAGNVVLSNTLALGVSHVSYEDRAGSSSSYRFAPGFDTFVLPRLSMGMRFLLSESTAGPERFRLVRSTWGIDARVGVDVELLGWLSWWPTAGVGYRSEGRSAELDGRVSRRDVSTLGVSAFAPLLVHPAPRFFAGFGPFVDRDLVVYDSGGSGVKGTTYGAGGTLGAWL